MVEILTDQWQDTKRILFIKQLEKFNAVIEDVTHYQKQEDVLIGNHFVEIELLSRMLKMRGVTQCIECKMHKQEAQIVEEAGKPVWLPLQPIWRVEQILLSAEVKAAGGLAIVVQSVTIHDALTDS
jgi:preprotein translocase subunit SecA